MRNSKNQHNLSAFFVQSIDIGPVLDLIFLDFWINQKAATLHHERQERFLLPGFAMLCNGFGDSKPCCHMPAKKDSINSAAVNLMHWLTFHSSIYVLFNFQSSRLLPAFLKFLLCILIGFLDI